MKQQFVNLATEYRPKTFSEVVGQDLAVSALKRIAHSPGIACRSIFLKGSYGSGKSTLCRIFGKAMNCQEFDKLDDVCLDCHGCQEVSRKNSQLYYEFDASVVGNVEGIAAIKSILEVIPNGRRVVVFDECHAISRAALNQLLKLIEEGVRDTIFVFASTEDILETIKSRSICIDIGIIPYNDIIKRVKAVAEDRNIQITESQLNVIALKSKGHMRNALSILQYFEMCGEKALDSSFSHVRSFIIRSLSKTKHGEALSVLDEVLKYSVVDIRDSIDTLLKSFYVSEPNSLENKILKSGAADKTFNFFYSPIASQAFKSEAGVELLLRAFYEKTTPKS